MMRRIAWIAVCIAVLSVAGVLVAQQKYPNLPDLPVVLENEHRTATPRGRCS